jgi:uncharacterized protein
MIAALSIVLSSMPSFNVRAFAEADGAAAPASTKTTSTGSPAAEPHHATLVKWQEWTGDLFKRARQENKPVLLDLEAIWCHWCHVEDAKTYSQPQIAQLLNTKFIPVKVDQDSRPDLSNRYGDYGWPATVIFKPNGDEIDILSGFVPPKDMLPLLESVAKNP